MRRETARPIESAVSGWSGRNRVVRARSPEMTSVMPAALGVPEHITVMYPFLHPDDVGEAIVDRLEKICSETAGFEFSLTEVRWFGEAVVWLAPRPEDPFRWLSLLVKREFGTRLYGGAYDEITPHLTIGDHGPVDQMRAAQDIVAPFLLIHARAAELALFQGGVA